MVSTSQQPAMLKQELKSAAAGVHFGEVDGDLQPEMLPLADEHPEPAIVSRKFAHNSLLWSAGLHGLLFAVIGATAGMISSDSVPEFDAIRSTPADLELIEDALILPEAEMILQQASSSAARDAVVSPTITEFAIEDAKLDFEPPDLALAVKEAGDEEAGAENGDTKGLRYQKPKDGQAVTSGSFTVWTVPSDPLPNRPYLIVVQLRVPKELKVFPKSDLKIDVSGSDRFHLQLPDPRRNFKLLGNLRVINGTTQIAIPIPGAPSLTRDVIRIESREILGEAQTLQIEF
jgi:hypothetical protein